MAGNILGSAFTLYGLGTGSKPGTPAADIKNPGAQYEYGQTGRLGTDTNNNGIREVDCSVLVYNAMRNAGYYLPGSNASGFTTQTLFRGERLTDTAKENFTSFNGQDVLSGAAALKPGDVLLFKGVNGNTSQHTAIFYGYDQNNNPMFYGAQTSTGPAIATINAKSEGPTYWNGEQGKGGSFQLVGALRPNESLYVPQMDLTGGAGTGLSSPSVVAAVNLLKQDNVEGYRPNIYSSVDGVPTVGNGLTLVVKGAGGVWNVLPENHVKDLLRDAGLPESKYNELPLDQLANSATLLNQGNMDAAKAVFGSGESGGFSVSPVEADKLSAAYVVRDVAPKIVNALGGSENLALMAPGEFAAVSSKLYQNPSWLNSNAGKSFVDAWWGDDTEAAKAALGSGSRGQAEANAYAGHINAINGNLGANQPTASTVVSGVAPDASTGVSDPMGTDDGKAIMDAAGGSASTGISSGSSSDIRSPSNPNYSNEGRAYTAPKAPSPPVATGDAVETELPDGTRLVSISSTVNGQTAVINELRSADGSVLLSAGPGQTMARDPDTGIVSVRTEGSAEIRQYSPASGVISDALKTDLTPEQASQLGSDLGLKTDVGATDQPSITIAAAGDGVQTDGGRITGYAETSQQNQPLAHENAVPGAINSEADTPAALPTAVQGLGLLNSLAGLQHWAQLGGLGQLSTVVSLYNQLDHLGSATGNGNNLPGDLGEAAAVLSLVSSLQSGNVMGTLSGVNALSSGAVDGALNAALGSSGIPYLSVIGALDSGNPTSMLAAAANFIPGYGPLISIGISLLGGSGGLFGGEPHKPPPPMGETHFAWGADGSTTVVVDSSVTGGGQIAAGVASNVQHMLQQMVDGINAQTLRDHPDTPAGQLLAINPNLLPAIGYGLNDAGQGTGWLHVVQPDGSLSSEPMEPATLAQHLLQILNDNGGLAPQWLVDTQYQRYQHQVQSGASQEDIQRELHAGQGGHASVGNQAYALQGNAVESADFKTQSSGVLVAHLSGKDDNAAEHPLLLQAAEQVQQTLAHASEQAQVQTSQVLRDVEGDGYLEQTQWIAANDAVGNAQGALVLDFNGNGLIETRDVLNLGGNAGQSGNLTDEAARASANADLQRNNVQWLDANGDGVLDARDPAFAAIKLWVDVNQDGQMQAGEGQGLGALSIQSIDFKAGEIVYEDGHRDVLSAATLKADTEGVRATQIQEVNADGSLRTLDAGEVLEHEGYQGQVKTTDDGGTRWGAVRKATFEQQAKRTGDWEGTALQAQHRHGGGNAAGSPSQTQATGATSLVGLGPALAARAADSRIAFVPSAQGSAQGEMRVVTAAMVQSVQSSLFGVEGAGGLVGLGALTAVALGSVQSAAQAAPPSPLLGGIGNSADAAAPMPVDGRSIYDGWPVGAAAVNTGADGSGGYAVAGGLAAPDGGQTSAANPSTATTSGAAAIPTVEPAASLAASAIAATMIVEGQHAAQTTATSAAASASPGSVPVVSTAPAPSIGAALEGGTVALAYPVVRGETLAGSEDVVLRLSSALLANDSTLNASADPSQAALRVTAVAQPSHGQVSLETRIDAAGHAVTEVVFVPELNYYGTAGFDYTVSDQYGLARSARVTLEIAAVNDAPVGVGETIRSVEDQALLIQAGALLQNDSDVDNAQADLRIARVQSGAGGTVVLNASGDVEFTPAADYNEVANGPATFTYWVGDPAGGESRPVTASVLMSPVNDAPVAQAEVVNGASEDAVFHIDKGILLANDTDVDDPASALGIAWIGSATGGVVALDANGNVVFTPTADFNGNATFQYRVRDAAGLESATVQAVIPVAPVNDAPVAVDDRFATYRNSTMTVAFNQLTGNDTDVDGDALTVSAVRDHANGTASIVNGQVQFVPTADFKGQASFDYLTDDGHGGQTWATAYVDVKLPPNLYPTINLSPGATSSVWYGGSAYYNAVEVWQNFSYSLSDESPGSVSMSIVPVIGDLSSAPSASNSFQYHVYDSWGADGVPMQFNILLTDQEGITNTAHVYVSYDLGALSHPMNGFSVAHDHTGLFVSPVLLDLMGDGLQYQSVKESAVRYDVNHDGVADQIAWAGNGDGVLVWDKDRNGKISDVSEFSFQALQPGAQTDLEGLRALDSNHDGRLDAGDEKFAEFAVWQDANGNGVTDAGEFKTLGEWGIAQISLKSNAQMSNAGAPLENGAPGETDVLVMGEAAFTRADGSTGVVADAMLAYQSEPAVVAAPVLSAGTSTDTVAADLVRMALLFNQLSNTASANESAPLGFTPIETATSGQEWIEAANAPAQQLHAA